MLCKAALLTAWFGSTHEDNFDVTHVVLHIRHAFRGSRTTAVIQAELKYHGASFTLKNMSIADTGHAV